MTPRELRIGPDVISDEGDCYVIAEIGHNHQGRVEKARELFKAARECGVNAVKLQKRHNATLYTKALYDQTYDNENSFGPTYGAHREALEFGWDDYVELKRYAAEIGVTFFATAYDVESADFLAKLDVPAYKIASGDLLNIPLIKHVARIGKPMIVSTGGGTMADVRRVYDTVMPINRQLCLLQCTAAYPAEPEQMNLRTITTFREAFPDIVIGLSDHQNGIAMADIAYLLGARVVEKHFTLNRAWKGSDHAYSLEPAGMRKLVRDLHRVRVAMGDGVKQAMACEAKPLFKMGKKLVAASSLPAGHVLTENDVAIKSPNDGLPPYEIDRVIGRALRRPLNPDDSIRFEDLAE
jgi:N-acetylneuraminate synthase/sialic acid synthase